MSFSQAAGLAGETVGPRRPDPYTDTQSREFGFRARRFAHVRRLIEAVLDERGEADIVDLGGTETYWLIGADFMRAHRHRLRVTLVNTEAQTLDDSGLFDAVQASAADPALFSGRRFDLVHSNSVIEHVGDWRAMQAFAANARRLAPRYYVQTPNYWFPFEPHFRFAGFQYLPKRLRVALLMRFALGFFRRIPTRAEADEIIFHHRLLSTREMAGLFPDGRVLHERFAGLNKSIIAMRDGA
ncbi:class I SAM-dependent methyltransferase [Aquibium sp. A9E412]|uniref:SAM-dependent methyltransferase n=1 Tax=Aquibium sp. A9E412 TaxID=2976767 RepID=UPI0025AF37B9|nr:SAM-dependent methyltransferase [Aquibium sp. A9E412]MDN2564796.1 class I SAM-dependent methyltransferase [Aquibium sp. A9E412]